MIVAFSFVFSLNIAGPISVQAATSPTLNVLNDYSVLGGQAVTCTGTTTTSGAVGVSSGTSLTGFPTPCIAGGGTHNNDASAIAAQAENLATYTILDQPCDQTFGAVDLTAIFPSGVVPGVYCSTSSFTLSGNLTLTGSGVWIFKTVSTLITSPNSSVTGGDPCNIWWRIGSSATLDTGTSFVGSIFALNGTNALNAGATLNGRIIAQDAATVSLIGDSVTGPVCAATTVAVTPSLPNTGIAPTKTSDDGPTWIVIAPALAITTSVLFYLIRRKQSL